MTAPGDREGTVPAEAGRDVEFHTADEPRRGVRRGARCAHWPIIDRSELQALSLPLSGTDNGEPIRSPLVASSVRRDRPVRVASPLESARPWADRRPPARI